VGGTGKFITVQSPFILFLYFDCKSGLAHHFIRSNTVTKSGRSARYSVENRVPVEQQAHNAVFPVRIAAHHLSNSRPRMRCAVLIKTD